MIKVNVTKKVSKKLNFSHCNSSKRNDKTYTWIEMKYFHFLIIVNA